MCVFRDIVVFCRTDPLFVFVTEICKRNVAALVQRDLVCYARTAYKCFYGFPDFRATDDRRGKKQNTPNTTVGETGRLQVARGSRPTIICRSRNAGPRTNSVRTVRVNTTAVVVRVVGSLHNVVCRVARRLGGRSVTETAARQKHADAAALRGVVVAPAGKR